eukprot:PhF_6_TR41636/c0_g1_i1/m.63104
MSTSSLVSPWLSCLSYTFNFASVYVLLRIFQNDNVRQVLNVLLEALVINTPIGYITCIVTLIACAYLVRQIRTLRQQLKYAVHGSRFLRGPQSFSLFTKIGGQRQAEGAPQNASSSGDKSQSLRDRTEWKPIKCSVAGVQLFELPWAEGGVAPVKTVGEIESTMEQVLEAVIGLDPKLVAAVSPDISETKVIRPRGPGQTQILYQRARTPFIVANRDFVYETTITGEGTDTIVIVQKSTECPEAPEVPKVVRGELYVEMVLEKIAENKVRLTMAAKIDPKGSIPTSIVNAYKQEPANVVARVRKWVS